ncbi:pectate lyase [Microbulbifer halophilus]|uniref:Pectate lyase n=1 Tax=Microbulbifer halophilus TaxID=453963 RepID=A0ABW5EBI5_9GAMM|nr:pectate lyase [Microbulbifer halophilus]MCW8125748.1 hypothetical protein [Microbulbifer halophilus]
MDFYRSGEGWRIADRVLSFQTPSGGWPQSFPLRGEYHDLVTFNDRRRQQSAAHRQRRRQWRCAPRFSPGIAAGSGAGRPAARAFEPVAMATSESADLLLFLMALEQPSDEIKRTIVSAHKWFAAHRIRGYRWDRGEHDYKELLADVDADALWARFYEIGSGRPVFGDRDGSVHYRLSEISAERRRGYGWYTEHPNKVLKRIADWRRKHLGR